MPRKLNSLALGLLALLAVLGAAAQGGVILTHVHGLAYSPDGRRLMIPSHHGLAVYENGKWAKAPGPQHDYMGFSASSKNLYSSGHPAAGSGLVNPFGLIRSSDGGKTWEKLGLEGETDFHLLAASWNTHAIYVWNPAPSSRIKSPGLHYTLNDGFAWKQSAGAGLTGEPRALAVHPDDAKIVAVATSDGLYTSRDAGERFSKRAGNGEGLAVFFDLDGKRLWYGSFDGQAQLAQLPVGDGPSVQVRLPALKDDGVAYIAQNPAQRLEYAVATFKRDVYLSKDGGKAWLRIAAAGNTGAAR
jgi:hypothetical protein